MVSEKGRKRLPPYISYRTFKSFIDRLGNQVPARIDRSYWGDLLSGSTGAQLMAALRFLNLIDNSDKPSSQLRALAAAQGDHQKEVLKGITHEAYGFVFRSSLDMTNATYAQLVELFDETYQLTPDVGRKCMKFFISLADDSQIPLSSFVTKRFRTVKVVNGITTTKNVTKKTVHRINPNTVVPVISEDIPEDGSWNNLLLSKFPPFDPNWSEDVKLKWFSAFDELLKRHPH